MQKLLVAALFLLAAPAYSQPADRDVTLTIPGARLMRVQAICERERMGTEPLQETLTLRACMRRILFRELRQRNSSMVRREAIADRSTEINAFDEGMAD